MNALILAAGYATRLYPLTLNKAKPLLEVGGKPIVEWVLDNLEGVAELRTVFLVTNDKFANDFQDWANAYQERSGTAHESTRSLEEPRGHAQRNQQRPIMVHGVWGS